MTEEVLINVTPQETRVALVENGVLQEVYVERASARGIVGNIYKGKIVRILPGMQAAFVDVGLERTAFLHASDVLYKKDGSSNGNGNGKKTPSISELLHDGQEVVVQVVKDPIGTKGARLTTQISIAARYLVALPLDEHVGVSQKIEHTQQRDRLRQVVSELSEQYGCTSGIIVRTVAETASDDELALDFEFLRKVWQRIKKQTQQIKAPGLIYSDIPLALRTLRDLVRDNVEKVRIDSREGYEKALRFARELIPEVVGRVEYYPGERPIFDLYSVEDEIQRALNKKVPLKSGGYLIIDQTEAMTTVDVNTGGFVGKRNLEETLFKTNLEATLTIARQLRLRNIGGIIIIDFIDMEDEEHRRQVMRALEKSLARDRVRSFIADMSSLGLVEVTRKRTRESLEHVLCEACTVCGGRGVEKTPQTIVYEIFREIIREARQYEAEEYLIMASDIVVDVLLDEEATALADLQEFIGKPIHLQTDVNYSQEQFDVVLT